MMCVGKCLSRGAVLRAFINICAKLLEMLWGEGEMHRFVREAAQQWGRCCPGFAVPEPKASGQGPGTWWYFPSGDSPNPTLSSAVPSGELCSCEGWNEARTMQSHCSSCVSWLAAPAGLYHLGFLMFHQQSFLIKILNQSSDYQFQTRCWQLWELIQVAMG